jgi:hypothetical protein
MPYQHSTPPGEKCGLTFEVLKLVCDTIPFGRIRRRIFADIDDGPLRCQFGIQLDKVFLAFRYVIFGEDGFGRAFRFAQSAVNAFLRIDDQEIRTFVEAVDGADIHAVGILAFDTVLYNNVSHDNFVSVQRARNIT